VAGSINRVVIVGNLTRDPEMRPLPSGTMVCQLRVAVNDRVKDQSTGEWGDRANYFDVNVFGGQGERCGQYLAKGRQVAVEGRLRWSEWETQDGQKRQKVDIVADNVQFIGPRDAGGGTGGFVATSQGSAVFPDRNGTPASKDFSESGDDDIPF
jgi:single-strand DNA-binding protein